MAQSTELTISVAKQQLFAGRFRDAFATAQSLLRADPAASEALLVLASVALEHGNLRGAADLSALAQARGSDGAWRAVIAGRVLLATGETTDARALATAAAATGSDEPEIAGQIGVLLSRTGLHGAAVPWLRAATDALSGHVQHRYNLAIALQFAGDLDAARAAFAALLADDPGHAKAMLALVQLDRQTPATSRLPQLSALFDAATDPDDRLALGHAAAKTCEDLGAWDASLDWLARAKAAKRATVAHDRAGAEACFAAAKAAASQIRTGPSPTPPLKERGFEDAPIFIVGLPRSGTTLVERIIASHPHVKAAGELSDFGVLLKRQLKTPGPLVLDADTLAAAATADLGSIGADYIARVRTIVGDTPRFIDKMPFNFFYVPAILRALPDARIICLRRSPFDTLFSNYRQLFATSFSYYGYAYDLDDTAHFVAGFEGVADHFAATLPARQYREQHYESLIADQRGETAALLAFLGLDWDDACLDFHRNAAPVATASSVQVRKPIYADAVERWRRYDAGSRRAIAALGAWGITP